MKFKLKNERQYEALSLALPGFEERFQSCCREQFLRGDQFCVDVTSDSGCIDNFEIYQDWHVSFYFDEIQPIFEEWDPFYLGSEPPQVNDEDWNRCAFCEQNTLNGTVLRYVAEWTGESWWLPGLDSDHHPRFVKPIRYIPTSDFPYCCMNHETH